MQLTLACLVLFAHLVAANQLPPEIEKCHYKDNKCLVRSSNAVLRRYGKTGLPAMNLDPQDVFTVSPYKLVRGNRKLPFWHDWGICDQWLYGYENTYITRIQGVDPDPRRSQVEIHGGVPSVRSTLRFNFISKFLTLKINATGRANSDFQNLRFITKFSLTADDKGYVQIYKLSLNIEMDRWIQELEDLFISNTDLTIIANEWLNKHWQEYWVDIEPEVTEFMRLILIDKFNKIFSALPYKEWFLP